MLLLLFNCPLELTKAAQAVHCSLLAGLAGESKRDLLGCLLRTTKNWLNTATETLLLTIVTTATESGVALFTTLCLGYLAHCVLLAELAEELLSLWMMKHEKKGCVN